MQPFSREAAAAASSRSARGAAAVGVEDAPVRGGPRGQNGDVAGEQTEVGGVAPGSFEGGGLRIVGVGQVQGLQPGRPLELISGEGGRTVQIGAGPDDGRRRDLRSSSGGRRLGRCHGSRCRLSRRG
jgi:hypothetical protein